MWIYDYFFPHYVITSTSKLKQDIIKHFNYKLAHRTLENIQLLKHSKVSKTAPKYKEWVKVKHNYIIIIIIIM